MSTDAALERMVGACRQPARPDRGRLRAAVLEAQADREAADLRTRLLAAVPDADVYVAPFSSVMVAHTGAGLVGLSWWWDDHTR